MRDRAFTLLELMAVIAILGLIGSAIGVSLSQAAERSRTQTAIEQISGFDANCRRLARRHGGGTIAFDMLEDAAMFTARASDPDAIERARRFVVPVRSVRVLGETLPVRSIEISAMGTSDSYVIDLESEHAWKPHRLLIAGGTGHVIRLEEGDRVDRFPH